MHYTSRSAVYGRAFARTIAAAFKTLTADPLIDTGKVRLAMDPLFNPLPDTPLADMVAMEANFSGYTAGGYALTVGDPVNLAENTVGTTTSIISIATAVSPFVSATIYGWWIDDGTNFIVGERFPAGVNVPIAGPGDYLQLDIITPIPLIVGSIQ